MKISNKILIYISIAIIFIWTIIYLIDVFDLDEISKNEYVKLDIKIKKFHVDFIGNDYIDILNDMVCEYFVDNKIDNFELRSFNQFISNCEYEQTKKNISGNCK